MVSWVLSVHYLLRCFYIVIVKYFGCLNISLSLRNGFAVVLKPTMLHTFQFDLLCQVRTGYSYYQDETRPVTSLVDSGWLLSGLKDQCLWAKLTKKSSLLPHKQVSIQLCWFHGHIIGLIVEQNVRLKGKFLTHSN